MTAIGTNQLLNAVAELSEELSSLGLLTQHPSVLSKVKKLSSLILGTPETRNLFAEYVDDDVLSVILSFLNQYELARFRCVNVQTRDAVAPKRVEDYRLVCSPEAPWYADGVYADVAQVLEAVKSNCIKCNYVCKHCAKPRQGRQPSAPPAPDVHAVHAIKHLLGSLELQSIQASVTWHDQGWGNKKGIVFLILFDKDDNEKCRERLFKTCEHNETTMNCNLQRWQAVESKDANAEEKKISKPIFDHAAGDYYQFWRYVGGGGGHSLTIKKFEATLLFEPSAIASDEKSGR